MAIGAALLVDKIGRRTLFLISNAGMVVAFTVWTVTAALYAKDGSRGAANATIALIFVYYSFYDIAYSPLLVAVCHTLLPHAFAPLTHAYLSTPSKFYRSIFVPRVSQ
jgi:hypothetical protein